MQVYANVYFLCFKILVTGQFIFELASEKYFETEGVFVYSELGTFLLSFFPF
jgi:hypothetical protein